MNSMELSSGITSVQRSIVRLGYMTKGPISHYNMWDRDSDDICTANLYYPRFCGQSLVRPTFLNYSQTSIIRGF